MKKLLFVSLLTVAVVFGATITLDDAPAPTKKKLSTRTTRTTKQSPKILTESAHKSGPGDEGPTAKTKKGGKKTVNKAGQQPPAKRPAPAPPAK